MWDEATQISEGSHIESKEVVTLDLTEGGGC